jgi:hypothetical protein
MEKERVKDYVHALEDLNKNIALADVYLADLRTTLNVLIATNISSPFTDLKLVQTRDRINDLKDSLQEVFYLLVKKK